MTRVVALEDAGNGTLRKLNGRYGRGTIDSSGFTRKKNTAPPTKKVKRYKSSYLRVSKQEKNMLDGGQRHGQVGQRRKCSSTAP